MKRRIGFTLVEMLVVISIIGILAAIAIPGINAALGRARTTACNAKMAEQGKAMINFATTKGYYPGYRSPGIGSGTNPPPISWQIAILPQLDRLNDYALWQGASAPANPSYYEMYVCGSDPTAVNLTGPMSSYAVNTGKSGNDDQMNPARMSRVEGVCHDLTLPTRNKMKLSMTDFPDGADVTILASENIDADKYYYGGTADLEAVWGISWGGSQELINGPFTGNTRRTTFGGGDFNFARPSANHAGVVNVVFAGGNTKAIDQGIKKDVWEQLMTPNGSKNTPAQTVKLQEGDY